MNNYTQLTMQDRCHFLTLLDMALPMAEIARRMNYHRSSLYRELRRNRKEEQRYSPKSANEQALARKDRPCRIQQHATLQAYVSKKIKCGWSPEQIAGRLKRKKSKHSLCHETIYRYIYKHHPGLHKFLPYKKPKRLKPNARKPQTCRFGEKRLIIERPAQVNKRKYVGHWEGDLIIFKGDTNRSVSTLVERKTRMVFLLKNENKTSEHVMGKIKNKFIDFPQQICKTITFDQGSEFANFHYLEQPLNIKVFYCHPHSPWEKGGNENMNGRLRFRELPKDADISQIEQEQLDTIAKQMNATPRKCLDYRTPEEVFLRLFPQCCRTSL